MKAIFIRHNLNIADETLNKLKSERLIAVHFENKRSVFPKDYKTNAGKRALGVLWKCCNLGAIVGADYGKSMLVGSIKSNSKVKIRVLKDEKRNDTLIFKTVKLVNVKEISYLDYPLLKAIQPRQITVTGWPSAYDYLSAILHNKHMHFSVDSLAPSQLEVVCYEYLKMKKIIEVLLMPIGRSLPDIDILGLGRGKKVVAQVTHSLKGKEIEGKMQILRNYKSKSSELIFFGPESQEVQCRDIKYITLESVFNSLKASKKAIYLNMLRKMLI